MNTWEKTLKELEAQGNKEAFLAKMATIGFLKQFKFETLTTEQLLSILEIIKNKEE